jgi:predicted  nucleic acid-binding Zn-ribbon protein
LNDQQVELWVEQKTIPSTVEQAFRRILEKKNAISELDNQAKSKQQEIDSIVTDQNRLRENMKALKGTPEEKALVQRYTHQLDTQEDRLASLRTEEQSLKVQRLKLNEELILLVQNVAIDQDIASGAS